jgi:hypothetical protein
MGCAVSQGLWYCLLCVQVERAIDNTLAIQRELVALLCIEGVGFMLVSVVIIIRLLRSISVHRQALFSVFLAVPQTYLRTLASKSVSIGDEDADEEEGACVRQLMSTMLLGRCPCSEHAGLHLKRLEHTAPPLPQAWQSPSTCPQGTLTWPCVQLAAEDDKIMQAAEEARRQKKKKQQQQEQADVEAEHDEDQWGSMPGTLVKALDKKAQIKKKGKKAFFADAEGDAAVEVSVKTGQRGKVGGTG